jgi:hypothetical protein
MRIGHRLLLLFTLLVEAASIQADTVARPFSFAVTSAQNNYVFVMIAPVAKESDGSGLRDEERSEAQRLRARYRTSGLYSNDGSTTPLWAVDWYAYAVLVPSDGIHLIRLGPWAENGSTEALTFFAEGKKINSYRVGQLVDTTFTLPHTASHFTWMKSITVDDASRTATVTTLNGDRYVIDFATGSIISARRPMRIAAITVAGLLLFVTAFITFFIRRKHRQRVPNLPRGG